MIRSFCSLVVLASFVGAAEPDFVRDVQPIFAKHCLSCHGPDKQKAGLRLDRKATTDTAIVAGKPASSPLIDRVTSADADKRMPPKGAMLSADQVQTLRDWIAAGAKCPAESADSWWSLQPIKRPTVPAGTNAIDAFVRAKLREKGLSPSPEADRRTLIRRLSFDLLGLPPTPAEVESFVKDPDPMAYEKLVDRMLDSPHFGERWARHWLDVVHYGDTHGYDKDKPRPNAWPYRDYVIRSFNSDKPYGRFVQEQVAGDVLYSGTRDGIEALGFIAAGPWDFIGHAELPEDKIDGKVARHLDRDDMVANTIGTFMSLTVHCAQCHNHKFDPIAQEDYYRLQAVFAALDRTDKSYDLDPAVAKTRASIEARRKLAEARKKAIDAEIARLAGKALTEIDSRIAAATKPGVEGRPEFGYHSAIESESTKLKWAQVDLGKSQAIESIVLVGCHDDFNNIGAGFGFPVRFKIEACDDDMFTRDVKSIADRTTADFANPGTSPRSFAAKVTARYIRVTATKLGLRQNDYIFALAELEARDAADKNLAHAATVTALDSIEAPPRWRKANLTDGVVHPSARSAVGDPAKLKEERETLLNRVMTPELKKERDATLAELESTKRELAKLPAQRVAYIGAIHNGSGTFVGTGPTGGKPRSISVLPRGDVTRPGKSVEPGPIRTIPGLAPNFVLPADHSEGARRAALAKWLASPENPLTWRSMANRLWLYHFGRGIVDSPNDLGRMGQLPTHPELLDWLAAELLDTQSLKHLHRLMVTSATYRQASTDDPSRTKVDANNAYFWRMSRRKLEAEAIRDSLLAVAGKLDRTPFGPGFQDFVIDKPEHSPHYEYHLHDPEDVRSHRRSIYRFIVRSQLQPFMATFDCADPSLPVDKRTQTISPLQALALLNNRLGVTMAKHFAASLENAAPDLPGRLTIAYQRAFGRTPAPDELKDLSAYAEKHGLANACRVIFNLNEFVFVD